MTGNSNRILLLVSLILFTFVIFYGCSKPEPPKLILSEESWHFGEVPPDEKPAHIFKIKNEGKQELIIDSVSASCSCVILDLSQKEIPPGQETQFTATFDPYGYEGRVNKQILIKSNDPENPEKQIELSIDVLRVPNPDVELSEQNFDLGVIGSTTEIKPILHFFIYNKGDADLIIEEIVMEEIFSHNLKLPVTIAQGGQIQCELSMDASQVKEGEFRKAIRMMTNDPQNEAVFLRIKGNKQ